MSERSTGATLAAGAAGFLLLVVVVADGAAAGIASALGAGPSGEGSPPITANSPQPLPTTAGAQRIPADYLRLYVAAAATCPGLPWNVLAAIGTVETDNGQSTLPGVHFGANYAGAEGPMQFEPPTFAEYDQPIPPGGADPPNPYDPADAIYAAARDLCANGARGGTNIRAAIFAYNHASWYVAEVLNIAAGYAGTSMPVH